MPVPQDIINESDLEAIAHLINICQSVDRLYDGTTVSELQQEFNAPSFDKARDIRLWEDAEGKLIGFAQLWISEPAEVIDGSLLFRVHPDARGGDIEAAAIAWGEVRMREVSAIPGAPVKLRSSAHAEDRDRISILTNSGFKPDRYFCRLVRELWEPIPEPKLPQGFTLIQFPGEQDSEAWVEMYNQSFIDHWNHHDLTVEKFKYDLAKPNYRNDLDLIVVADDGKFVSFCYCEISVDECDRTGRNEGWIACLGTRRGFRKIGLGRAMLLAGLHRMKAAGVETAILGVDADNPSGALQLYESVGFHNIRNSIAYLKELESM